MSIFLVATAFLALIIAYNFPFLYQHVHYEGWKIPNTQFTFNEQLSASRQEIITGSLGTARVCYRLARGSLR
jgi:hypothetical protein